jgi:hypothetical protein
MMHRYPMRTIIINVYAFSQFLVASLKYRYENPRVCQKNSRLHKVALTAPKIAERPKSANTSSNCIRTENSMDSRQSFLRLRKKGLTAIPLEAQRQNRIRMQEIKVTKRHLALSAVPLPPTNCPLRVMLLYPNSKPLKHELYGTENYCLKVSQ